MRKICKVCRTECVSWQQYVNCCRRMSRQERMDIEKSVSALLIVCALAAVCVVVAK
jgi:hypothetical protein